MFTLLYLLLASTTATMIAGLFSRWAAKHKLELIRPVALANLALLCVCGLLTWYYNSYWLGYLSLMLVQTGLGLLIGANRVVSA